MARAIWSGSISFGLVSIPVKLYTAVSRKNVSFNQIDKRSGSRVKQKRAPAADGSEVSYDNIVKGYELPSGDFVTITDEELASLDPDAARTIDILEFVELAEIDPLFYDAAYFLVPDEATAKPYKLLATAMESTGKVGIARFVMRTKQYLAAVRPQDGRLLLSTMVYADELVSPEEIDAFAALDRIELNEREVAMAEQLIASLTDDFAPDKYEDTHRQAVLDLIDRKASGETDIVAVATAPSSDKVIDLLAALEASVKAAKGARERHPAAKARSGARTDEAHGNDDGDEAADADEAPKRSRKSA